MMQLKLVSLYFVYEVVYISFPKMYIHKYIYNLDAVSIVHFIVYTNVQKRMCKHYEY